MKCSIKGCCKRKKKKSTICSMHNARIWKSRHPIAYKFNKLKWRARERGIAFTLTIEEFTAFCQETSLHILCGKTAGSLSLDRIDETRGYSADNIQVLTLRENTFKMLGSYEPPPDENPF